MGWNDRIRRVEPVQEIPRPAVLGAHIARDQASRPQESRLSGGARRAGRPVPRAPVRAPGERIHEETAQAVQLPAQVCARDPGQICRRCRAREIHGQAGQRLRGSVPVCAGSADSVNQQRRGTRAARDSGAQEDTRIHQVKGHDAVAREPVLVCHDMAAARHRPPLRDRKIRLDGANTHGWRSAIFLRNFSSSSRCLRINLSNCSFLTSTFCLSSRYSALVFLYSFLSSVLVANGEYVIYYLDRCAMMTCLLAWKRHRQT